MRKIIVVVCVLFYSIAGYTQYISGGVLGGVTTSQINGDGYGGFYNVGITAGGYVEFDVFQQSRFRTELRFTQKGSGNAGGDFRIEVGYVEVPVLFSYSVNNTIALFSGLGAGFRVYEYIEEGSGFQSTTSNFGMPDVPWYVGGEYHVSDVWYFDMRSVYSVFPIDYKYHHWCLYLGIHYFLDTK
ncbi:MAG: hypothetical protein R6U95_03475 [Bacteroidales bacterium]